MTAVTVLESLRRQDLFADLGGDDLVRLAGLMREKRFAARGMLCRRGEAGDCLFLVSEGLVRLSLISAEGREVTIRQVAPGGMFGEIALLDGGERTADATAMRPTTALVLARGDLLAFMAERPAVALAVVRVLCTRLRATTDQLEGIALLPLEARLARCLVTLAEGAAPSADGMTRLPRAISQGDMAGLVAATRPKVNRILVAWTDEGLIARDDDDRLRIDFAALSDLAQLEGR
ncbi:MAG: Crp/Fnr family transcriptional regulator [Zavarzinia sp.]|nr:Crp/Fnr family transcriptional regulator [Zavarzinia sp.]